MSVNINISDWFNNWIDIKYSKGKLRKSTINIYRGYLKNYIEPKLGYLKINDISIKELQSFYDEIIEGQELTAKTLKNMHSVIHNCFKEAVKLGVINNNPSDYVELPTVEKKEVEILEDDEILKLKEIISEERLGISILIALDTGLRLGELLALKWNKVDLDENVLKVTHSLSRQAVDEINSAKKTELVLHEPKTQQSKREVPLKEELVNKLIAFKNQQKLRYKENDIEADFVLSNKYAKPIDPRSIQEFFKKMQEKAKIRKFKFHHLRHTFASRAIKTGVSDKVTSQILGHSNVTTTLNIYTHVSNDMIRNLIDKM